MFKRYAQQTNLYVNITRTSDCSKSFNALLKRESILATNVKEPRQFFHYLHDYCQKHKTCKRTKRENVEAVELVVMIPSNMRHDQVSDFAKEFAIKALHDLPYVAFKTFKGNGTYITYLISERRYLPKAEKVNVTARSDFYQKTVDGKKVIAKASDPEAICVHQKGKVYKTYHAHFTDKKDRIFTGCEQEFKHKLNALKRIALTIITSIHYVSSHVFIKKINAKKSQGNFYWYQNIRDLNNCFMYIEQVLNDAQTRLTLGYLHYDYGGALDKIKYRYMARANNKRFKAGHVSISIHYCLRRDWFRDNLQVFIDGFDTEMAKLWERIALPFNEIEEKRLCQK